MNALYFFLAWTLAFIIPGHLLIRKLKLDPLSEVIVSMVTGFVVWSLLGFFLGFLHLRNLIYPYLLVCLWVWIKQKNYVPLKHLFQIKIHFGIAAIILIGTLIQLSSIWPSGIQEKDGWYFCCGIPDTIAHLALTNELVSRFPPNNPGFSNIPLANYHYLSNLAVADLIRVFRLPLIPTQYQYMTVVISILLGLTAIALAKSLQLCKQFMLWFLFFLYFCGDIIFLLPLISGKGVQFSLTTLENASTLWISPPRFYSLVILLTGLTLFVHWLKKKDVYTGVIMAMVLGSLIGFKVYVGMFVVSGFAFLALYYIVTKKYSSLLPIILMYLLSFTLWMLVNKDAGGLAFTGFWRFEDFIVQPVLGLSHLELARRVFLENYDMLRAFLYDLFFAFLYIVFSSGTVLLGFFQTKRSMQKIPRGFTIVLVTGLISTCIAGFFFLQKTGGANSSQFLISIYIVGAIYASLAISWWTRRLAPRILLIVSIAVILFTSTRVIHDTYDRVQRIINLNGVFISNGLWNTYRYFATTHKESVVLVYDDSTPDCLFITFIGARATYTCMSGLYGAIKDVSLTERSKVRRVILYGKDLSIARGKLLANNISYIFIPKEKVKETNIENMNLPLVYETDHIAIYKTLR